ncbi:hypothetical protein QTP88_008060 [Uroleucon formosanum]
MFNRPTGFNDFKLQINGQTIEWSHSSKYLGLTIDQDLKFKDHIKNITKRAIAIRGMLYQFYHMPVPPGCHYCHVLAGGRLNRYKILAYGQSPSHPGSLTMSLLGSPPEWTPSKKKPREIARHCFTKT